MCVSVWVSPTGESPSKEMRRIVGAQRLTLHHFHPDSKYNHAILCPGPLPWLPSGLCAHPWQHGPSPRSSQPGGEERPRTMEHPSRAQVHSQVNIQEKIKHNRNYPREKTIREVVCWHLQYGLSVNTTQPVCFPAAPNRWPPRWLSTSGSTGPACVLRSCCMKNMYGGYKH